MKLLTKTPDQSHLLPGLNLNIPTAVAGLDDNILNPRNTWSDKTAYDEAAASLAAKFQDNFKRYDVTPEIVAAGPGG